MLLKGLDWEASSGLYLVPPVRVKEAQTGILPSKERPVCWDLGWGAKGGVDFRGSCTACQSRLCQSLLVGVGWGSPWLAVGDCEWPCSLGLTSSIVQEGFGRHDLRPLICDIFRVPSSLPPPPKAIPVP